ncbi:MAG TPA: hypothetical protein GXZ59_07025 [Clostridiaceae bacterium]|nr:hypothetical protein [Clostridiaceae bacterium]
MARYCFYCGKQLDDGEKCNCRSQGYYSTSGHADTVFEQYSQPKEDKSESSAKEADSSADKEYSDNFQSHTDQKRKNQQAKGRPFFYRDNAQRRARTRHRVPGLSSLASVAGWIRTPADKIREQALDSKKKKVPSVAITINLLILMLWFSLFYYRISLHYHALNENITGANSSGMLVYSLAISVLLCFLESFFIWILLRLMERLQVTLIDVLRLSRPAYVYLALFVILAIGTVVAVPLASLAMVMCGFMFAIYVHIRSICHVYNLSGNSQIRLMVFAIIFFAASFTFVEQLIPVLIKIAPTIPAGTIS